MNESEKSSVRAAVEALLVERFGAGHGCRVDVRALLRVDGDTSVRFMQDGAWWYLKLTGSSVDIVEAK